MDDMMVLLGLLVAFCASTIFGDIMTGYGNNQFSTKTAYFWSYPKGVSVNNNLMTLQYMGKTCNAVHFNFVARHGSRYTGADDMEMYTKLWEKITSHRDASSSQFTFLDTWQNRYPKGNESRLTTLGREELFYLGLKYSRGLLDLLQSNLDNIKITATEKSRTQTSAKEFYAGLTNVVTGQSLQNMSIDLRNDVLRAYDGCESYEKLVDDNKELIKEMTKFREGQHFQSMLSDVQRRLGLNTSLSIDDIRVLYELSAIEIGVFNSTDWSTILTDADREVLEYGEDTEDYMTRMYGHELNAKVACPLVKTIVKGLNEAMEGQDTNKTYTVCDAKFSHSTAMGHFYSALELFKDAAPLRADNFDSMKNRRFLSSKVLPMATNAAFILYHCGGTGADNYQVKLYVNEIDTAIPGCKGNNPCPLSTLNSHFDTYINSCNMDKICALGTSKGHSVYSNFSFVLIFLMFAVVMTM